MNIDKALKIDGWMRPSELAWLAEAASNHQRICEVGSWMGRSTRALVDNTSGSVMAVDTWKGSDEQKHKDLLAGKPEDWLFRTFVDNIAGPYKAKAVWALPVTSLEAAKIFTQDGLSQYYGREAKFDMIFLDASHDYDNVKADIAAWMPLLELGGLLCGHDFSSSWPGVVRAVREGVPHVDVMKNGHIWFSKL